MNYKNFAYSLVATAPSPATTGTSLVVTASDGTKFPTPPFYATIYPVATMPSISNAEIVKVTDISTDTFTIIRQQEDTSARTVIVGDRIAATITAETIRTLVDCVFTQTASKTVSNTTSETTLSSSGVGSLTLPANFFSIGKTLRLVARGYRSTTSPAGTIRLKVKLGSTIILDTGAVTATNNLSNKAWEILGIINCRTIGASGTVMGQGRAHMSQTTTTANFWELVNTSTTTIDTTSSQLLDITVQWGTASASNTISCSNLLVEELN